ncbi:MAG: pilus assembly PilX N-terminal domain-containing protein [Phycisphaerae bacterium]
MALTKKLVLLNHRGVVLIISMIFVLIFSALAISMATLSGTNVQLASNQHKLNSTLSAAQSGLEVMQYWLTRVIIPNSTQPSNYLSTIVSILQNDLADNNISNISLSFVGSTITIPSVTLASADHLSFEAAIRQLNDNTLQLDVTGRNDQITRTIRVNYNIKPYRNPIFDYGIATKGPLNMQGNPNVDGLNQSVEADVYIESANNDDALLMKGNSAIAGDVSIANPDAIPSVSNSSSIGGETGQDAIDNHIIIPAPYTDFPVPNPVAFENYVDNIFEPTTDTTTNLTLENIRIPPDTNPHFSGHVILKGIVFIESPNIVEFTGNADITGIIIGDGDLNFPYDENQLIFRGNVDSRSVSELDATFGDIREETGTFLLAPGFSTSFGGSFETLNGVIAASGIEFFGNAGGTINGSVINYSDNPMTLDGSIDLVFDRLGLIEIPAGFDTDKVLEFQPGTYTELAL